MQVQEIMSRNPVTCRATDTLNTPAKLMWEHDCGSVPVLDDDGKLVGMVTDRDICMAAYTKGVPLHAITVANAMAREVFTCRTGDSIEAAERLMSEKQIRRIPVMDGDNRPAGILSVGDIARYATSGKKSASTEHDFVETLAGISKPRPRPEPSMASQPTASMQHVPPAN